MIALTFGRYWMKGAVNLGWHCEHVGPDARWSNPDALPLPNALVFLWQRLNVWKFEGPWLWCIVLEGDCLKVYSQEEKLVDPNEILINLTARQVHDEIQIYMQMMESKE